MNTHRTSTIPSSQAAPSTQPGEASGKHQGLHRPSDDQRIEQALDHVGLDDRGEVIEDQLRDRRGSGIPPPDDVRSDGDDARGARR